jgi:hypothetical protein
MDEVDRAQVQVEALTRYPQKKPEGPPPAGYCLYCAEPLPHPQRWCDPHCRDDWAVLNR